jgi:mono/diheme cytochrome c family protein
MYRFSFRGSVILVLTLSQTYAGDKAPVGPVMFETHIRPLLKTHCFECHGEGQKLKGGLDMRLRRLLVKGGKSGPALVPGKESGSLILERLASGEMPPGKKKLTKDEITVVARWIAEGARTLRPEPEAIAAGFHLTHEEQAFWAFQPIRRPALPTVKEHRRIRTPIDAFLLARLDKEGLSFSSEADRATLIRRVYFDLLGLPPSPAEIASFLVDPAADAYERLVDRLLSSSHYGERWGRHWLDVAGYADSEGYTEDDAVRVYAYKYRDYVIRAFNADMPLDCFIQEQLAGDEMVRPPYANLNAAAIDKLTATGFLRMAPDGTARAADRKLAANQVVADTIQIVGTSLLGLTVHCAQCHNHRYDPIPQSDYYHLRAVFEPAYNVANWRTPAGRRISLYTDADRKQAQEVEKEAAKIDQARLKKQQEYTERTFQKELAKLAPGLREPVRLARNTPDAKRTAGQQKLLRDHPSVNVSAGSLYLYDHKAAEDLKKLAADAAKVRATKTVENFLRALTEIPGQIPVTHIFNRGDHEQPREAVSPGGLMVLASLKLGNIPAKEPALPTTGRRLALARWLTSGKNPLTARVLVNRVWLHHFGRGIVGTPGDFGYLGQRPTHPELLDWLANEFMAGGWRLKRLHKLIMTSTAYRQSSLRLPHLQKVDPDNRLLARMSVRRLDAEAIRDAMLAINGKLTRRLFGPPVPVMHDDFGQVVLGVDTADSAGYKQKEVPLGDEEFRRSVYVQVRRSRPLAVLDTFDAPAMTPNCECRNESTVTPQALMLMNSRLIVTQAKYFAERLQREAPDVRARVALGWRLSFGTEPKIGEVNDAMAFLSEQAAQFRSTQKGQDSDMLALASFCQALLSSNRFLYVD